MTRQYIKNNHYPVWNWCNVEKKKKKRKKRSTISSKQFEANQYYVSHG